LHLLFNQYLSVNTQLPNYLKTDIHEKIMGKQSIQIILFLFITFIFQNQIHATQVVAFYNCENFYDTTNQMVVND
jgi:hypothetical protein